MVITGKREGRRNNVGVSDKRRVIMGIYEIKFVKLLKILKHIRI